MSFSILSVHQVRGGAEGVEHELADGRGGVQALLEAHQVDALVLEGVNGFEQLAQRLSQAVEPSDAEAIPGPGVTHEFGETGALEAFSGDDVDEHPNGAGFDEPGSLNRALAERITDRYARLSAEHGPWPIDLANLAEVLACGGAAHLAWRSHRAARTGFVIGAAGEVRFARRSTVACGGTCPRGDPESPRSMSARSANRRRYVERVGELSTPLQFAEHLNRAAGSAEGGERDVVPVGAGCWGTML